VDTKLLAAVASLALLACSASSAPISSAGDGGPPQGSAPSTPAPAPDASASPPTPLDAAAAPTPVDAAASSSSCDGSSCASLSGLVKRTSTAPLHGGKGSVYVAIFDGNPVTDATHAVVVARTLIANTDLSASGAQVAYRVDDVPVRAAAYQVIAFLDDGNAVSASNPQPASGDLISLQLSGGISGVPVTLASPGDDSLDLPLNAAMP
jgi:hypothetical protein